MTIDMLARRHRRGGIRHAGVRTIAEDRHGRDDGAVGARHRALCAQQAPGRHDRVPAGAHACLYVHGATYPAHTAFDLKLDGMSWMDYIAARGYDVYLLDLRGYGKSTRPKEMAEDAKANPPIVRGDTAVKDIGKVVDFILARRNIPRLNLIGWSWGTH